MFIIKFKLLVGNTFMNHVLCTFQIATIVHSRQSRDSFDPQWMDLYEKVVMETQADKVTPLVVNPGRVLLSTSRLYFQPYNKMGEVNKYIKIYNDRKE